MVKCVRQPHFCQFEYFMTFVTLCMQQTLVSCLQTNVDMTQLVNFYILYFLLLENLHAWVIHSSHP